jgi:OOP family OmpA-OmpF porin
MSRVEEPPVPPAPQAVAEPPAPVPVPVPPTAAAPVAPPVERVVLDADALFAFNKATLTQDGTRTLDQVATHLNAGTFETISITGHTDRIGAKAYNARLSEQRAQAVRRYLADKGVDPKRMDARGVGSSQPVTGSQCDGIKKRNPLIRCLQPDRRVDIQVVALR